MSKIILIQKYIRRFLVRRRLLIPSSFYQTKIWRKQRKWYKNGKSNECEKYQLNIIEQLLMCKTHKTYDRMFNNTITCKYNPHIYEDGYEYSENFDGKLTIDDNVYYFNL